MKWDIEEIEANSELANIEGKTKGEMGMRKEQSKS